MKKIICCLILSASVTIGFSQVSFGVKSGINIATTKDINSDPKNRIGWYAGGFTNLPINKKIFIHPELLFSAKGYKYIGNLFDTKKTAVRLNYIVAPILLGYKIDTKTSFFAGPEIGYLLSANVVFPNKEKFNASDSYTVKIDIGLDVGLSYQLIKNIGIGVRYCYSFKNMYSTDAAGTRIGEKLAGNRVFQIGAFYSFSSFINNKK